MLAAGYNVYFFTPCRIDALAMGTLLAAFEPRLHSNSKLVSTLLALAGTVFLALVVAWPFVTGTNGAVLQSLKYTAEAFVYFGLMTFLIAFPGAWPSRIFGCGPMAAIGTISYGLYVYHPFCYRIVRARKRAGKPASRRRRWESA